MFFYDFTILFLKNGGCATATAVSRSRCVPMLFSTPMVQAILNETKTETRRIVKFPKIFDGKEVYDNSPNGLKYSFDDLLFRMDSPVKVGDIIWVRETFAVVNEKTIYKSSICSPDFDKPKNGWTPSLFMPKKACRIFLEVVSVSVERLQDIDEQSAINEGIENLSAKELNYDIFRNYLRSENEEHFQDAITDNPIYSYQTLWQKINGKNSWDLNPFVWVYKFRSISVPPDFC